MREEKRGKLEDLVWFAICVVIVVFVVSSITGCEGSLSSAPREWTDAKAKACQSQGGVPVVDGNWGITRCSADLIW